MGDLTALTQVPGIGKKGAERLVLELRDRLGAPVRHLADGPAPAAGRSPGRAVARPADRRAGRARLDRQGGRGARSPQLAPIADEQVAATGGVEIAVLLRQALRLLGRRMSAPLRPVADRRPIDVRSVATARRVGAAGDEERVVESALRPHSLAEFIGQPRCASSSTWC